MHARQLSHRQFCRLVNFVLVNFRQVLHLQRNASAARLTRNRASLVQLFPRLSIGSWWWHVLLFNEIVPETIVVNFGRWKVNIVLVKFWQEALHLDELLEPHKGLPRQNIANSQRLSDLFDVPRPEVGPTNRMRGE